MSELYKGIVIEESLLDNRIINNFKIIDFRISKDENPADRWHLYTMLVTDNDITQLSENIKPGWYMHFWKNKKVIVIFPNQKFEFQHDDVLSWKPAIEYGISIGIPKEQLDFPID